MIRDLINTCITLRQSGISQAIPSYCTANMLALEAILLHYKKINMPVLLEATSNQVNQFGGYTGMCPVDYKNKVFSIAQKIGFNCSKLHLAGDHLGPLPWAHLPAKEAMENAHELVRQFVLAGYAKIHLDTSIRLGDDEELTDETIAKRGVELYKTCQKAWRELRQTDPFCEHLSFIIGSEVPPAGGSTDEHVKVTSPESLEKTLKAYSKAFAEAGIDDAWDYISAIVVQPGVEYSNFTVHKYDRGEASSLCAVLERYPRLCFEGHSTDFQPAFFLRQMAEDGISILKVGPALTFALREALFNLCEIEHALIDDESRYSRFRRTLLKAMERNPKYWEKYYHGSSDHVRVQSKFSYLDRSRYYLAESDVHEAMYKLISNIDEISIPGAILHQYFPMQYYRLYSKGLPCDAKSLIFDYIAVQLEEYEFAAEVHKVDRR